AAGSQPIKVICRIKQIMPATGLPIVKKVSQGSRRAISNRMAVICVGKEKTAILTRTQHIDLQEQKHVKHLGGISAGILRRCRPQRSHSDLYPAEYGSHIGRPDRL